MDRCEWKPIADLPHDWYDLRSIELENLGKIWRDQAKRLKKSDALVQFNQKLRREWAIETGIIENLYSIDRGTTRVLIEQGIDAALIPHEATDKPREIIVSLIRDQEHALEAIFEYVSSQRPISTSFIKNLHQVFTNSQQTVEAVNSLGFLQQVPMMRGDWRKTLSGPARPKDEMCQYSPPEQIASEMDRLIELHLRHVEDKVSAEVEAAWLHHRFSQVHPFQDGNGRVARALASLILIKAGWFPLVIDRDVRLEYIMALEEADKTNLKPLVDLFVRIQKKAFLKALSVSQEVIKHRDSIDQMADAVADMLKARSRKLAKRLEGVFELSRILEKVTSSRFDETAELLNMKLKAVSHEISVSVDQSIPGNTNNWYRTQIVEQARKFDYWADMRTYSAWVRLKLRDQDRQAELVTAFHSIGNHFTGVLVVSPFLLYRDKTGSDEVSLEGPYTICKEVFQFSYIETEQELLNRYDAWLNETIILGVDQWRRQL
ncbi:MAG: Fic family protein [Desulfomonilaceae bacterium]